MSLSLDGARERSIATGHCIVECVAAVWTYRYTNGYTVRDLLYLNTGNDAHGHARFREVGETAGIDTRVEHALGAVFSDLNGDGRLDLYVANDANPNRLYRNVPSKGVFIQVRTQG